MKLGHLDIMTEKCWPVWLFVEVIASEPHRHSGIRLMMGVSGSGTSLCVTLTRPRWHQVNVYWNTFYRMKARDLLAAGYIYAPYIPLMMTKTVDLSRTMWNRVRWFATKYLPSVRFK